MAAQQLAVDIVLAIFATAFLAALGAAAAPVGNRRAQGAGRACGAGPLES